VLVIAVLNENEVFIKNMEMGIPPKDINLNYQDISPPLFGLKKFLFDKV